ncbi:response regulator transcription factor [Pelagicoccus sp. SDUM812005]|uniref:response regulator transcription factor n=1 Tax=Pelagicoccus sp. SDUM812005 TaxID=3041257 RepID=UPI00280F2D5B|nr:response regulator transcription factor [Pelagicoccus sp. SDUM812005]MDQ8183470.1 response regulator transcription factor [Pelagicoccus sp. SDUM812005]
MQEIKVMLVEDHPDYAEVIAIALDKQSETRLISEYPTAERALRSIQNASKAERPDIILLDLNLPGMSGLESIPWFKDYSPDSQIIVLSQSDKESDVLDAIRLGAAGYLLKSSSVSKIKESIQNVAKGEATIDNKLAKFILNTVKSNVSSLELPKKLSERELEILKLLADGLLKKEIAAELGISLSTVVTHTNRIYAKLEVRNTPSAISKAYKTGIFTPGEDA